MKKKNLSNKKVLTSSSQDSSKKNREVNSKKKSSEDKTKKKPSEIIKENNSDAKRRTTDSSKVSKHKVDESKKLILTIPGKEKKSIKKEKKTKHSFFETKKIKDKTREKKQSIKDKTKVVKSEIKRKLTTDELKKLAKDKERLEGAWEEIDFYPLIEPFAYAYILRNRDTFDRRYLVVEPPLSDNDAKSIDFIIETLQTMVIETKEIDEKGAEGFLEKTVREIIDEYMLDVEDPDKILYVLKRDLLELGKLTPIMKDHLVEDVSCDGAGIPVYVYHRTHGSIRSNIIFNDEDELSAFVVRLAQKCGKHISIAHPMLDATMPDGSRVQMTLSSEITTRGSTFTIRKFRENPFSPVDIINFHTMSPEMVAYFWMAVEYGVNALISGGTASGKTSTLNAIALFIPREAKIVSIEETREINLPHPNWIPGVTRLGFGEVVDGRLIGEIDLFDLMKAALRQRPEYIIVGEIRGREAYVLFQAMATGHVTYSTIHADSTRALINRLEGKPINIPRSMMHSLDLVILQGLYKEEGRNIRRCKQIVELVDIDPQTNEVLTNTVFKWDPGEDEFIYSGKSYILDSLRIKLDMTAEEMKKELARRVEILKWMQKKNLREFKDVARIVDTYRENPAQLLKEIKEDVPVKEILEEHSFEEKIDKMAVSNKNHDVREKLHEITLFLSRYKPGKNKRRGK